jgi:Ca2+-binding RTX toxin-like protein
MSRRPSVLFGLVTLAMVGVPVGVAQASTETCFGQPATIVGTEGPDDLVGQSGVSDVIYAGGGNDSVLGGEFYSDDDVPGAAPDLLCGGPGDDRVYGGPGDDKINGGDGNDHVDGRLGADVVQGNAGDDRVVDESFADMDSADDVLRGGIGNDEITTAWGVDEASGDAGDDTITDSECSTSYLLGGPGADTFESYWSSFDGTYCGADTDVIHGGSGSDRATASSGDSVAGVESVQRIAEAW